MIDPLLPMARFIEDDPLFLGSLLVRFGRSRGMDDAQLAEWIGCPLHQWTKFKLCGVPRQERHLEAGDIKQIALAFNVGPDRLTEAVRRGRILLAMSQSTAPPDRGILMAARKAEPTEEEE